MPRPAIREGGHLAVHGHYPPSVPSRNAGGIKKLPHERRIKTLATRNTCPIDHKTRCYDKTQCAKCAISTDAGQQRFSEPKPKVIKVLERKGIKTTYYKTHAQTVKEAYDKMHKDFKQKREVKKCE